MIEFLNDGHRERFVQAGYQLEADVFDLASDWAACLFILTADSAIWNGVRPAVNFRQRTISFPKLRKLTTGHGWQLLFALANQLFNGGGRLGLSDLVGTLDDRNWLLAMRAIQLRRMGLSSLKLSA